jgi:hypothetical protein
MPKKWPATPQRADAQTEDAQATPAFSDAEDDDGMVL